MSVSADELARPTLRVRGLLGQPEPILSQEDEPWQIIGKLCRNRRAKLRNAVAIAEAGREGEDRFFGEVDASVTSMQRIIERIAGRLIACVSVTRPDRRAMAFIA